MERLLLDYQRKHFLPLPVVIAPFVIVIITAPALFFYRMKIIQNLNTVLGKHFQPQHPLLLATLRMCLQLKQVVPSISLLPLAVSECLTAPSHHAPPLRTVAELAVRIVLCV